MNKEAVAKELISIAKELIEADSQVPQLELTQVKKEAALFPSQKALQNYMHEHPGSDRGKHKVNYDQWKRKYRKP